MASFNKERPYNELPDLPPSVELQSPKILRAYAEAKAKLAGLNQAVKRLPNIDILVNSLPLIETQASSAIENIVTTTDRLFELSSSNSPGQTSEEKECMRYRTALRFGVELIEEKPLNTNLAETICTKLLHRESSVRRIGGTYIKNISTKSAVYTPPEGENLLRSKLANWEKFLHEYDLPVLIKMAIGHYQFEAIHPFHDGNGRTGRILNILYLVQEKVIDEPVLYLSSYILKNKTNYYEYLRRVTEDEDWETWVCYMLKAVEETSEQTMDLIENIDKLLQSVKELVKSKNKSIYSWDLIQVIFSYPYCRIENVVGARIAKRVTAKKYLDGLRDLDILDRVKVGKHILYINRMLMDVLYSR